MRQFVIERELPGAHRLSPAELKAISRTSCDVLNQLGSDIRWLHSYVATDKIYCLYEAANEDLIKEHAQKGGFPANRISEVATTISPATAERVG